ncbi:Predicted membrane protein [Phaffia rhodozyma]|uniref:Predicted membrane protein n=1 Tax=Phaffia rhodozyma TaxID=264483 RepID=A0A0F7SKR9_PHARH|nr:Predicted membrane protein [Phaffia rhodozyma]
MGNIIGALTSIGIAIGPPLIYADQAWSIIKKQDSTGFSRDVCAIILIANIARCVFWLGNRFELALLFQSIFLCLSMLVLLFILLKYRKSDVDTEESSRRPFHFWDWTSFGQYVEFLAGLIVILCVLYLIFGGHETFIDILGFIALGIESQLPTPQAFSNFRRRSCYGLRISTLAGWLGGDIFKTCYFFFKKSPKQFIICGLITISIDLVIVAQMSIYGTPRPESAIEGDDESSFSEERQGLTDLTPDRERERDLEREGADGVEEGRR